LQLKFWSFDINTLGPFILLQYLILGSNNIWTQCVKTYGLDCTLIEQTIHSSVQRLLTLGWFIEPFRYHLRRHVFCKQKLPMVCPTTNL